MTLALIVSIASIGLACWLLFTLATLALPLFAAVMVGTWVYGQDGGILAAVVLGALAAMATLMAGQLSFALSRLPLVRLLIGLMFAVPAAMAGYHAVHGIAAIGVPADGWRQVLGVVGSIFVGCSAWMRIATGAGVVQHLETPSRGTA